MAALLTRIVVLTSRHYKLHCYNETHIRLQNLDTLVSVVAVPRVGATGGCGAAYLQLLLTATECLADASSPL